jgi:hypothetical protein
MRATLAAVIVAALSGMVTSSAAAAKSPGTVVCGPKDRWCISVIDKTGRWFFDIYHFDYRGKYQVCVTPPEAGERCKTFTLLRNGLGAYASSIRFTNHFPHRRHGHYKVRWLIERKQLGKSLTFSA